MAERVYIIDEWIADSDSEGKTTFEGFNFEGLEDSTNVDESKYDVLNEQLWNEGDTAPYPLKKNIWFTKRSYRYRLSWEISELFLDDNDYEKNLTRIEWICKSVFKQHAT